LGRLNPRRLLFDITVVEIVYDSGRFVLGRYGILEVQHHGLSRVL